MNLLILIFLTVSVCWHNIGCKTISTPNRIKTIPLSMEPSSIKNIENHAKKQFSWENLISSQNSSTIQELKRIANIRVDPLNRTSRILGRLAFLAGLSVNGLTNAAKFDVQSHTKFPSLPLNVEATQISPQIAAIYNPYSYLTHPYVLTAPLNVYPLWDPLRLQSFTGTHNNFQSLPEHLQSLNLADSNKQTDLLNNNDEYVEENKKVEDVKGSSEAGGEDEESNEDDPVSEKKVNEKMTSNCECNVQKKIKMKPKDLSKEQEDVDSFDQNVVANIINKNKTHDAVSKTTTNTTIAMNTTENSTGIYNYTSHPFYGYYYGGYPQNINHVDLTTETNYKYHTYDHFNYNLASYDKPINFYPDQRYNYYSGDLYPSHQFHQEQIPEHFSNDFKRHVSDNTPIFRNSDFKPMV